MRGTPWLATVALLVSSLALSGCMQFDASLSRGTLDDPYRFTGRLDSGDGAAMTNQIHDRLGGYSALRVSVHQHNDRVEYAITVNTLERCEEAREAIADLPFVRTRSACAPP